MSVDPSIVQSLTVDQITDIFQKLPNEVCSEYAPNVLLTENQNADVPSTFSVMITFLHGCNTYHELFNAKLSETNSAWISGSRINISVEEATQVLLSSETLLSKSSTREFNSYLQIMVDKIVADGRFSFEGVMIDKGAAKSPTGPFA